MRLGATIAYTIEVRNDGNVALGDLELDDPLTDDEACPALSLDPGESMECSASYTITDVDVDVGVIENTAQVTGTAPNGRVAQASGTATFPIVLIGELGLGRSEGVALEQPTAVEASTTDDGLPADVSSVPTEAPSPPGDVGPATGEEPTPTPTASSAPSGVAPTGTTDTEARSQTVAAPIVINSTPTPGVTESVMHAPRSTPPLAFTGRTLGPWVAAGVLLLVFGSALTGASREYRGWFG